MIRLMLILVIMTRLPLHVHPNPVARQDALLLLVFAAGEAAQHEASAAPLRKYRQSAHPPYLREQRHRRKQDRLPGDARYLTS